MLKICPSQELADLSYIQALWIFRLLYQDTLNSFLFLVFFDKALDAAREADLARVFQSFSLRHPFWGAWVSIAAILSRDLRNASHNREVSVG